MYYSMLQYTTVCGFYILKLSALSCNRYESLCDMIVLNTNLLLDCVYNIVTSNIVPLSLCVVQRAIFAHAAGTC